MTGKFFGLGVGPGDPDLITVKAYRILQEVDTLCVPRSAADKDSLALQVVKGAVKKDFHYLDLSFPMSRDKELLENSWAKAGEAVAQKVGTGHKVAFVTIGDPMFYSTYGYLLNYLRKNHPQVETETVPGVMAMSACTSVLGVPLAEGDETLAVLPAAYGLEDLENTISSFDNVVLMKVNRKLDEVRDLLDRLGLSGSAVYFSRCGYHDQFYTAELDALSGQKLDYMSLMLIKKKGFKGQL